MKFLLLMLGLAGLVVTAAFPLVSLVNTLAATRVDNSTLSGRAIIAPVNGPGFHSGIAYSQYSASGQCRGAGSVNTDVQGLINHGHDLIRIYGIDCDGPRNVWSALRGKNMGMFLGIYNWQNAYNEANSLADQLGNDFSQVNTVSVGNEVVNGGQGSADAVVNAMNVARSVLRSRGYKGPVVTTDTMIATLNNPQLCTAADYCAFNCHAWFDGGYSADRAGEFVTMFKKQVQAKIGNKPIVISESGWPSGGQSHGVAVPGKIQQAQAVSSLKAAFSTNLILFTGYNEYWKQDNAYSYGAEHFWGIYGDAPGGR